VIVLIVVVHVAIVEVHDPRVVWIAGNLLLPHFNLQEQILSGITPCVLIPFQGGESAQ